MLLLHIFKSATGFWSCYSYSSKWPISKFPLSLFFILYRPAFKYRITSKVMTPVLSFICLPSKLLFDNIHLSFMYSLFTVENILERGLKLFSSLFYPQWPKYFLTQSRWLIRIVDLVREERKKYFLI